VTRMLLLVEDNRALNTILGWQLGDLGWAVTGARSCTEALALARQRRFAAVVLDYHLPDGDGLTLFRALLRLQPELRGVLVSGDREVSLGDAGPTGLRGVLAKPVHLPALLRELKRAEMGAPAKDVAGTGRLRARHSG